MPGLRKVLSTGAINFADTEKVIEVKVGSVILAPGFRPFDPTAFDTYNYAQIKDVVTSLEYERLLSASGPCMGHLVRPSDHTEPKRIAWLQCVGSRGINKCDNAFCSSVCCMYAIKQALVTKEHTPGDVEQTVFYMDIRSHGKEFEKYYVDAGDKGINFVRARPHSFSPGPDDKGVSMRWVDEQGGMHDEIYDMVVLSIGLEAPADATALAETADIRLAKYRFAKCDSFSPVSASREGIYVAGCFQSPKDIPQSVTEASSAAACAAITLAESRGTLTKEKTYPRRRTCPPRLRAWASSCAPAASTSPA
jgi:heterodisulfide reductase subunit A